MKRAAATGTAVLSAGRNSWEVKNFHALRGFNYNALNEAEMLLQQP